MLRGIYNKSNSCWCCDLNLNFFWLRAFRDHAWGKKKQGGYATLFVSISKKMVSVSAQQWKKNWKNLKIVLRAQVAFFLKKKLKSSGRCMLFLFCTSPGISWSPQWEKEELFPKKWFWYQRSNEKKVKKPESLCYVPKSPFFLKKETQMVW
mgnify:CR=1 FL=1